MLLVIIFVGIHYNSKVFGIVEGSHGVEKFLTSVVVGREVEVVEVIVEDLVDEFGTVELGGVVDDPTMVERYLLL